jgi:hypothetical protein
MEANSYSLSLVSAALQGLSLLASAPDTSLLCRASFGFLWLPLASFGLQLLPNLPFDILPLRGSACAWKPHHMVQRH